MQAFRIHRRAYPALDGLGAARTGGRWNPLGLPMAYAAVAFEGALLEQLARANVGRLPRDRVASRIAVPQDLEVETLDVREHAGWDREATSRRIGEAWARSGRTLTLVVPSVVARPWGSNVLINPAHHAFGRVEVAEVVDVEWDPRLA